MRRLTSVRERVIHLGIILVCIMGILIITISTPWLQEKYERKDKQVQQKSMHASNKEENQLVIDTEALFRYKGISIDDEEALRQLISILPAGNQVEKVMIKGEVGEFGLHIQYKNIQDYTTNKKSNIEQLILINSTILMSLCSDLEGVIVSSDREDSLEERLVYKGDLDRYFKADIRTSHLTEDFKKYSEYFLKQEAISSYVSYKYTYSASLGEKVDYFFKLNFPTNQLLEGQQMPYIDEDMGEALAKEYGYKLFVEGLKYNNDYMSYYSAYRLLEFYNVLDLEEVLIELAMCKNRTSNEAVKLACTYVMEVLGSSSIQEPLWVTRFRENTFGGGRKVYLIKEGKIKEWGQWVQPTAIKEYTMSPDGEQVWCYGITSNQMYAYVLPVENESSYRLGEGVVTIKNKEIAPELINSVKDQLKQKSLITPVDLEESTEVRAEWFEEVFLKMQISSNATEKVYNLFYNPENQMLTLETIEGEDFSLVQLVYELNDSFVWQGHTHIVQGELGIEGIRVYLDDDYITTYEYSSMEERIESSQILEKLIEESATSRKVYFFEKGRLVVVYEGEEEHIIEYLTEVLK